MSPRLSTYRSKRHAAATPEPMGSSGGRRSPRRPLEPAFVVQEHHASALHWDFRLERDGVLVSWALPKGLPEDPKANHLAVHVEDHPLEYASFEGEIPSGEYGAGTVAIWDHGTYECVKWRTNEVMVVLHGSRANGRYVLFPTGGANEKNWMIHRMDPAREGYEAMPTRLRPMLAEPGRLPARHTGWAYEFKWDGVRSIVYVDGGRVRALTRNDKDLVASFPELRDIGEFLGSTSAILDGEIVALDDDGRPSFGRLQQRLHLGSSSLVSRRARDHPATFLAFDVLYLDGRSTTDLSYDERRELLEGLGLEGETFATPPSVTDTNGRTLLGISRDRGLEGLVIKRRNSSYAPGKRNGSWIKVKNVRTQEVLIGGFTAGKGALEHSLGALLIGVPRDGRLEYVGKVGTGFGESDRIELLRLLEPIASRRSPFAEKLSRAETALAHFVRPELVGEVQYGEWTSDGRLRHPSWRGLRPDKEPNEVVRES